MDIFVLLLISVVTHYFTKVIDIPQFRKACFELGYTQIITILILIAIVIVFLMFYLIQLSIFEFKNKRRIVTIIGIICLFIGTILWYGISLSSFFWIEARLIIVLVPLLIYVRYSRVDEKKSTILISGFVPVWLNFPTDLYHIILTTGGNEILVLLGAFLWLILPVVCFLIVIPIGIMNLRNNHNVKLWILLPSAIILVFLYIIRGVIAIIYGGEYSLSTWINTFFLIALTYIPMIITTQSDFFKYENINNSSLPGKY